MEDFPLGLRQFACAFVAVIAVLTPPALLGQAAERAAARAALAREPEIMHLNANTQSNREFTEKQRALPNDDPLKQSPLRNALGDVATMQNTHAVLQALEARLQQEAVRCHFCSSKQEELSELIREEMSIDDLGGSMFGSQGGTSGPNALLGLTSATPEYWRSDAGAKRIFESAMDAHCSRLYPRPAHAEEWVACKAPFVADPDGVMKIHENAWEACFKQHDWVEDGHKRGAYEACMVQNDQFSRFCASDPGVTGECRGSQITAGDVSSLRANMARWVAGGRKDEPPETIELVQPRDSMLKATVVQAVVALQGNPGQVPILGRARLKLLDEVDGVGQTSHRRVVVIPRGTQLDCSFVVRGPRGNLSDLDLRCPDNMLVHDHAVPTPGPRFRQTLNYAVKPGDTIFPVDSVVPLVTTHTGSKFSVEAYVFARMATAADDIGGTGAGAPAEANTPAAPPVSPATRAGGETIEASGRTLLPAGTALSMELAEAVTASGARHGQLIRATLRRPSSTDPNPISDQALHAISAVWIRGTLEGSGRVLLLTVDHLEVGGAKVRVTTGIVRETVNGPPGRSSADDTPLLESGKRFTFHLRSQVTLESGGR